MKLIKYKEFREEFGNSFLSVNLKNFPDREFLCRARGNVYYMLSKPGVKLPALRAVEREANGKDILFCILPNEVIERVMN
jgi:hypothetical protein